MSVCLDTETGDIEEEVAEVYLIKVQDQHGNETHFTMVNTCMTFSIRSAQVSSHLSQTSCFQDISLLEFACAEVSISYATVTVGSVSEYSPPQNVCVLLPPGIDIRQDFSIYTSALHNYTVLYIGEPDAAQNIVVCFEEDLRPGFEQHAILKLSWESPSGQ